MQVNNNYNNTYSCWKSSYNYYNYPKVQFYLILCLSLYLYKINAHFVCFMSSLIKMVSCKGIMHVLCIYFIFFISTDGLKPQILVLPLATLYSLLTNFSHSEVYEILTCNSLTQYIAGTLNSGKL